MKRKHKKLKKTFLVYVLTFFVVTFCSAFLTVTVNYDSYFLNNSSLFLSNTQETGDSSALSSTVASLMSMRGGVVNVVMAAGNEAGDTLDVDASIKLRMQGGIENIEVGADVILYFNNEPFSISATYIGGWLYLSVNGSNFKMQVNSLAQSVQSILGLIGMNMGDAGSLGSMFDMNALMGLASDMKEVATDFGTKMEISSDNVNVSMNVDNDFMLKSIDIANVSVGDYFAHGEIVMSDINSSNITIEPASNENEYNDVTPAIRLINGIMSIPTGDFSASVVSNLGFESKFDILYDMSAQGGKISTRAGQINFDTYIIRNNVYFNSGNARIKVEDLKTYDFTKILFEILEKVGVNSSSDIKNQLDLSKISDINFSEIDLGKFFDLISVDDDKLTISAYGKNFNFEFDGDRIKKFYIDNLVSINFDYSATELVFENYGYVAISDMEWVIKPITEFLTTKKMSFDIYANIDGEDYEFNVRLDFIEKNAIEIIGELFGKSFDIIVDEQYILLNIGGERTKIDKSRLTETILELADKYAFSKEINFSFDLNTVINGLLQLTYADQNSLTFENNDFEISYSAAGTISLIGNLLGKNVNILLIKEDSARDVRYYNHNQFADFMFTSDLAKNTKKYIESKEYNIDLSARIDGKDVTADVYANLNDNYYAARVTYSGETISVISDNDTYYIAYRQFKFFGSMENAMNMLAGFLAEQNGNDKFASFVSDLMLSVKDKYAGADILKLLTETRIGKIKITDNVFELNMIKFAGLEDLFDLEKLTIGLEIENKNIHKIYANYGDMNASILIKNDEVQRLTDSEKQSYTVDLDKLVRVGKNVYDYAKNGEYILQVDVTYDSYSISGKIAVIDNEIKADLLVVAGEYELGLKLIDKMLYVNFENLAISAKLGDADKIIALLEKLGIDTNKIKETLNGIKPELPEINDKTLVDMLAKVDLDKFIFSCSDQTYILGYGDYKLIVSSENDMITGVSTNMRGVIANIQLIDDFAIDLTGEYLSLENLLSLAENEIEYIKSKDYAFEIRLIYGDYDIFGHLYYGDSGWSAELETFVSGKLLKIKIIQKNIYIDFDGFKLKADKDSYVEVMQMAEKYVGIKLPDLNNLSVDSVLDLYNQIKAKLEEFGVTIPALSKDNLKKNDTNINDVLSKLYIDEMSGGYKVTYDGVEAVVLENDNKLSSLEIIANGLQLYIQKTTSKDVDINDKYLDGTKLLQVFDKTIKTIESKSMSGTISVDFVFENIVHQANILYNINFENLDDIRAKLEVEFKGLTAEIVYINKMIYFDVVGLKFQAGLSDYDNIAEFVKSRFGIDISLDELKGKSLNDLHFDFVENAEFNDDYVIFNFKNDLNLRLDYDGDKIKQCNFSQGTTNAKISLVPMQKITIDEVASNKYLSYTKLFDLADSVRDFINSRQFSVNAKALVYEDVNKIRYNVDIGLVIDALVSGNIQALGNASVYDGNGKPLYTNVRAALEDQKIYVDFDGLRLSISQDKLREIMVIALSTLGIDTSSIPWLGAVDDDMKFVPDNLKNFMPVMNFDTLGMLRIIKSMNITGNHFEIVLDGALVVNGAEKDMRVAIDFAGNKINKLKLYNIYSGVSQTEYFDLTINFNEFEGVEQIEKVNDKGRGFIDISDSSELIRAFINTSELDNYTLNGKIKFNISNFSMNAPISIIVKNLPNGKTVAQISVKEIPMIAGVNGSFAGDREFNVYMYDDIVYLYRVDDENHLFFREKVEKKLALTIDQFMGDIIKYICEFGLGFKEGGLIMNAINKALNNKRPDNEPIDMSNVLLGYNKEGSNAHKLILNMKEIAYNDDLDTMIVTLYTINNAITGNKDYLYKLAFALKIDVGISMSLTTDDLTLDYANKNANVNAAIDYINGYGYKIGECYEISDGKANLKSNIQYTANFYDGSNMVRSGKYNAKQTLDLSAITRPDGVVNGIKYSYTFSGWYLDANFETLAPSTMPTHDINLYAKFERTAWRYVSFDTQDELQTLDDIYAPVGTTFVLPTLKNKFVNQARKTYEYAFDYWTLNGERVASGVVYNQSETLVAIYKLIAVTDQKFVLTIVSGGKVAIKTRIIMNSAFDPYTHDGVLSTTLFYSDDSFKNQVLEFIMPESDLTIYARNKYTISFTDAYGLAIASVTEYEGNTVSLETLSKSYTDNGKQEKRVFYKFNGYTYNNTLYTDSITMMHGGGTLATSWTESYKYYYTVSFKIKTATGRHVYYYGGAPNSYRVLEGEKINAPTSGPTCYYILFKKRYLTFKGWTLNGNTVTQSTTMPSGGDIELKAVWS